MLPNALSALFPTPAVAVVLAVLGVVSGPFLAQFAARRSVQQPLALVLTDEHRLIVAVLGDVKRLPYLTQVSGKDFAVGRYGRIWSALLACSPECQDLPDDVTDERCAELGEALGARRDAFIASVRATLSAGPAPEGDVAGLETLLAEAAETTIDDAQVIDAGEIVLAAGRDRNFLSGAGLVVPTATPDSTDPDQPPLQRMYVKPSRIRQAITSLLTGLTAAAAPGLVAAADLTGVPAVLAIASVLTLLVLSIVISLVDLDTFYIDLRVFLTTGLISWLFAIAAALATGDWHRLLHGVLIVVGVAALFEGANKLHRLIRKMDGQGFGDTLIVIATVGVPPAIAGAWTLGYYSVMAGMIAGVVGWCIGAIRGKLGRFTPFAFGPYLAAGWVIAWIGLVGLS